MKIELHIFTNATAYAPSTEMIQRTYNSFIEVFGNVGDPKVWYDPKPNKAVASKYENNLKNIFDNVNITTSLADGYVKAISQSNADFLFMLEHDWIFNKKYIHHTLDEICEMMNEDDIYHIRFNKRKNRVSNWDKFVRQQNSKIPYCVTPSLSNNPHIIKRDLYNKKALQYIKVPENGDSGDHVVATRGIEDQLTKIKSLTGAIYGPLGHNNTIIHLDGRKRSI